MSLPAVDDHPVCQYCGEPVGDRRVECARCATPHHRECFVEGGGCTTYACGSRAFVEAGGSLPVELPAAADGRQLPAGWWLPPELVPTRDHTLVYRQAPDFFGMSPLPFVVAALTMAAFILVLKARVELALALLVVLPLLMLLPRMGAPELVVIRPRDRVVEIYDDQNGRSLRRRVVAAEVRQVLLLRHRGQDADFQASVRLQLRDDTVLLVRGFRTSTTGARAWARTLALATGRPLFDDLDGTGQVMQTHELRGKGKSA